MSCWDDGIDVERKRHLEDEAAGVAASRMDQRCGIGVVPWPRSLESVPWIAEGHVKRLQMWAMIMAFPTPW